MDAGCSRRSMAMYPVDILPSVDYDDLLSASDKYLSSLESSTSEDHEWFDSLHHTKVQPSQVYFKILSIMTLVVNAYYWYVMLYGNMCCHCWKQLYFVFRHVTFHFTHKLKWLFCPGGYKGKQFQQITHVSWRPVWLHCFGTSPPWWRRQWLYAQYNRMQTHSYRWRNMFHTYTGSVLTMIFCISIGSLPAWKMVFSWRCDEDHQQIQGWTCDGVCVCVCVCTSMYMKDGTSCASKLSCLRLI